MQYEDLMPGVAQVVAISVGHSDEGLDGIDVLLLHFCDAGASCQQGEPRQRLYVRIPLQLETERECSVSVGRAMKMTVYSAVPGLRRCTLS